MWQGMRVKFGNGGPGANSLTATVKERDGTPTRKGIVSNHISPVTCTEEGEKHKDLTSKKWLAGAPSKGNEPDLQDNTIRERLSFLGLDRAQPSICSIGKHLGCEGNEGMIDRIRCRR